MRLWGLSVPGVARVPVQITGQWAGFPKQTWEGVAVAPEEIVAVVFLRQNAIAQWAKSRRGHPGGLPMQIVLSPYEEKITINVGIGGAYQWAWTSITPPMQVPAMPEHPDVQTGQVVRLVTIDGQRPIEVGALFLARSDVAYARKGIFHIRKRLAPDISGPLARILTYGRIGKVVATEECAADECRF